LHCRECCFGTWIEIWKWNKRKITHNPTKYKNHEKPIVSVDWLHEHLKTRINYSRCHLETPIEDIQIKGARTFIKTKFSDTNSPPNTVPNSEAFATACRKMGIHNGSKIVVYDTKGIYSSPRAWWLLRSWDMRLGTRWRLACLDKGMLLKKTGTII
jgi:hypothetical protein